MLVIKIPAKVANIGLSIAALLLALLLLEAGSTFWLNRLASPEDYRRYALYTQIDPSLFLWTGHHYLNYYPSPNYQRDRLAHNSLGYRGDEFPVQKPPGVYRVVALGGSTVYTEKVKDNAQTFTARLQTILRDKYGYQNVQVINAGVPGYNTWESLINLEFRVLDLEPDLVIIYHSTNDVDARLVDPAAYRGDNSGARKQWHEPPIRWWERSTLLRIVGRKLDWGDQVRLRDFVDAPTMLEYTGGDRTSTLQQNPPVYFRRNLANMIAVAQENGVAVMLATWAHTTGFKDHASKPYYQQAYREQNAIVIELGRSHDIPVFDFAALMPADHRYWADGRHVNEAGAQLKAELFAQFIDQAGLIPRP